MANNYAVRTDSLTEYLVTASKGAKTRNGGDYTTLRMTDGQSERTVNVWDNPPDKRPLVGELVAFTDLQENDGKYSARHSNLRRKGPCPPEHPLYHLLPHPLDRPTWDACIARLTNLCSAADPLTALIADLAPSLYPAYTRFPAATTNHHAFPGGLLNHTYQMLRMLEGIYPTLPYPISLPQCTIAILFHDYGKVYEYLENGDPQPDMALLGHVFISANRAHNYLKEHGIDDPTIKRVTHIILAHHGQYEFGAPVLPCTQEAILVNALDNLSAKMDALNGTPHMERCFALSGARAIKQ